MSPNSDFITSFLNVKSDDIDDITSSVLMISAMLISN